MSCIGSALSDIDAVLYAGTWVVQFAAIGTLFYALHKLRQSKQPRDPKTKRFVRRHP